MNRRHVVHVVCTDAFAGVERYVHNSAIALAHAGHRVTVVGGAAVMGPTLAEHGVAWQPSTSVAAAVRSLQRIRDADVVLSHMTAADVAAAVGAHRRTPIASIRHFAEPRGSRPAVRAAMRAVERRILAEVAVSSVVAQHCHQGTRVILTGVDDVAHAQVERERTVLLAQRLEAEKDSATAVRAWALSRLGGWRLLIAGDGSQRGSLQALAASLGVEGTVDFLGHRDDVGSLMNRASMLVAPTPHEGLGLTVIEAMAHGLPVIAANAGGHLETVGRIDGAALATPGDARSFSTLLVELAADDERRAAYGEQLRDHQRAHLTSRAQTSAYLELIDDLTPGARA